MRGQINRYNVDRGFGWIRVEDQIQLEFFHVSQWNGSRLPVAGQKVEFERGPDRSGRMQAVSVTPIIAEAN
jgi:cold shock CspA family protein